jgi:hypothetical protein
MGQLLPGGAVWSIIVGFLQAQFHTNKRELLLENVAKPVRRSLVSCDVN